MKAIHLPGLNGLRAIAALGVLISHITRALDHFGLDSRIFGVDVDGKGKGLDLAGHGVTIFFTLSGFLITFLILKEKEISKLKIKEFYIRRILRIWPLYYLYFFIALLALVICHVPFEKPIVLFYFLMAANFASTINNTLPFLVHYWSLGVEEQFYLFFPHLAKLANKKLLKICISLIMVLMFLKFIFWILKTYHGIGFPFEVITINRFHTILFGVVGAILYFNKNEIFIRITTNKFLQLLAWSCILLTLLNQFHIASVIDTELLSLVAVILIIGQITGKNKIINLENKFCDFLGKISYGIYVIHPLLIFVCFRIVGRLSSASLLNYLFIYALIGGSTIILAYLSYEFYEKKFLKLKLKYTTVKSSSSLVS